jgi:hypothetical protein
MRNPRTQPDTPDGSITFAQAFSLHSRPSATRKIVLDFDGYNTTGRAWNSGRAASIVTPAYDTVSEQLHTEGLAAPSALPCLIPVIAPAHSPADCAITCKCVQDGDATTFSQAELNNILAIWRGVAEDYSTVFDVDVTTEDPGDAYLANWGVRAVIGGSSKDWYGSAGGVAYVGVFPKTGANYGNYYQPAFVFPAQLGNGYPKYVWEVRRRGSMRGPVDSASAALPCRARAHTTDLTRARRPRHTKSDTTWAFRTMARPTPTARCHPTTQALATGRPSW